MTSSTQTLSKDFVNSYKDKTPNWGFNGLGYIVYKRTYSRIKPDGQNEEWFETVERCINGAQKIGAKYTKEEMERLYDLVFNLKCNFAGRMLWQLGTSTVERFGANSLLNCWNTAIKKPEDFCFVFENLMLGGGVGFSIRREDVHELPKVKKGVKITHECTKDADFIVPDSRSGWVALLRDVLNSYFETGKSFSYSTILVRGAGEPIAGFGGTASGPVILVEGIEKIIGVLKSREGKKMRSVDALDICNIIGSVVVAGNVRRSAEIALGDPDDILFLRAKRWDLGNIPNWRAMSNNTIYADDFNHVMEEVWDGYKGNGEPYGFFNLPLSQKYGRLKDGKLGKDHRFYHKEDDCIGTNPSMPKGVLVQTKDGIFPIENLEGKEFLVKNLLGEYKRAKCFFSGKNKKVYKIGLGKNKSTYSTAEHKWPVFRNGSLQNVLTTDLKKDDRIPLNICANLDLTGKYDFTYDEGLLVGALLGDGWLTQRENGNYTGGIVFSRDERDFAEKILKLINSHKENKSKILERDNSLEIQFSDNAFCSKLINIYGIELSKNKAIPKTLWESNDFFIKGFVDGLLSTDGCIDSSRITLTSSRKNIAEDFSKLLSFYGINSGVKHAERTATFPNGKDYDKLYQRYDVCIGYGQFKKFNKIFSISNPNKQKSLDTAIKDRVLCKYHFSQDFVSVSSVSEFSNEDVWDISVNDDFHVFPSQYCFSGNCGEISLSDKECCNLAELYLNNITSQDELNDCARLLYKTQKAIAALPFIHEETNKVVHKNMRLGLGATGICQSLDKLEWLDKCYEYLREFDKEWSKINNLPISIKLTTCKPSGSLSLLAGSTPGVHPAFSRYYIRRVRMSSGDKLVQYCRDLGLHVEFALKFDKTIDHGTAIVEFPCFSGESAIIAADVSAIKQLEIVKKLQNIWADNAVSVTVYYKSHELAEIQEWMKENYGSNLKSVSFLLHSDHGFIQAPYSEISEEEYKKIKSKVKPIKTMSFDSSGNTLEGVECAGGACPIR